MRVGVVLALGVVLGAAGCGGASGPVTLRTHAASVYADAPVAVDVLGLKAHQRVTLKAAWTAFRGRRWSSSTALRADREGRIALRGFDGMRFLWAMRPVGPSHGASAFAPPAVGPSYVALSIVAGSKTLARTRLSRRVTRASVRVRDLTVERDGVSGVLFSPAGVHRRPAVLTFGGSEGGNSTVDVAGLLAAHGYPTLALAYFRAPGLPQRLVNVPLEYFKRALRLLRRQPDVDPGHLVTLGASRGGEGSLLVASTFPALVHGAVGLVPSANVNPSISSFSVAAWTYRGRPLASRPIAVEKIDGPVLTAGAGLDNVWDSPTYISEIDKRLDSHHFHFAHRALLYRDAGHDIGIPEPYLPQPTNQVHFGGTPRDSAAAKAALWPHVLAFLGAQR